MSRSNCDSGQRMVVVWWSDFKIASVRFRNPMSPCVVANATCGLGHQSETDQKDKITNKTMALISAYLNHLNYTKSQWIQNN